VVQVVERSSKATRKKWSKRLRDPRKILATGHCEEILNNDYFSVLRWQSQEYSVYHEIASVASLLRNDGLFSLDDIGAGYSSLSYLNKFDIDTLKIDQSFVKELTDEDDNAVLVKAVISMGNSLNHCVLAEGIETLAQYTFLLTQHCDEGQGNYFSHPLPTHECTRILRDGIA